MTGPASSTNPETCIILDMSLDTNSRSEEISRKCECLRELFREQSFPNHFAFTHRIDVVEFTNETDTAAADVLLERLFLYLKKAPDGEGSTILNMERHGKYFPG